MRNPGLKSETWATHSILKICCRGENCSSLHCSREDKETDVWSRSRTTKVVARYKTESFPSLLTPFFPQGVTCSYPVEPG
jgi:hypothetical protein